jgi:hypothetical protein
MVQENVFTKKCGMIVLYVSNLIINYCLDQSDVIFAFCNEDTIQTNLILMST